MASVTTEILSPGRPNDLRLSLVKLEDLDRDNPTDYHMHTNHTDGTATVVQMAEASAAAGLKQIMFTEHVRHTSTYYPAFVEEVGELKIAGIDVFVGIETKVLDTDGSLDCSSSIAELADGIVASVHGLPLDAKGNKRGWKDLDVDTALELEFELAMAIVTKSRAHILGHPMGMAITRFNQNPVEQLTALASACRDSGKAFELNPRYCANADSWLQIVSQAGCKVSLGSDAHKTSHMGRAWQVFIKGDGLPDGKYDSTTGSSIRRSTFQ